MRLLLDSDWLEPGPPNDPDPLCDEPLDPGDEMEPLLEAPDAPVDDLLDGLELPLDPVLDPEASGLCA